MDVAFCYESVLPNRGGCETYIADLARRLIADRHVVHLYACRWDEKALPTEIKFHQLPPIGGPRFLRPWRFGKRCLQAMAERAHDVTIGFDKTWGQDVLYPQGGLHRASRDYNLRKHRLGLVRIVDRVIQSVDLASLSFRLLERRQYLGRRRPVIVVNSRMVRDHFQHYYGIGPMEVHVVPSAIASGRFPEHDRLQVRQQARTRWNIAAADTVGLLGAMNYRLKGLDPLLHAVRHLLTMPEACQGPGKFILLVAGNSATAKYERLAQKLNIGDHVRFVGHCAPMRQAYFAADFLVHPTFYDPCSLVVLEALACGLPVITTRANGASELLHPLQEGFVIDDPHDHQHLAWCMAQLLDSERRQACARASRKTGQTWTFEHHYRQLLKVCAAAMARKVAA